jgi:formate dehydrogenase subunit gamma
MTGPARKWIERYDAPQRINHWTVAITFVLAALSGFALFHPSMFWLAQIFGSGTWARILHPFIGVVMFISFAGLAVRLWRHNRMQTADATWLARITDVAAGRHANLPPVGRYNGGQKLLFWVMVASVLVLLVTGFAFWQPWFAPLVSVELMRIAVVLHALAAFVLMLGIIVHIYAAIWVTGTMRAMVRGTVSAAWARKHHPAWYRQATQESRE